MKKTHHSKTDHFGVKLVQRQRTSVQYRKTIYVG